MVKISIIIPTFNRRGFIVQCLQSVAQQRLVPFEVIVIDDGSTDGTQEAVLGFPWVTLVTQHNAGPGAARNRGARIATGEYLAFLDSDDLWFPWSLEAIAALIERHDKPTLLFARFTDFVGAPPKELAEEPPRGLSFPDFLASASFGCFAGAGMMVIQRAAFVAVCGFSEARINAEDHDLALRLGTAVGFVQVTQPIIVAHRIHSGNEMGKIDQNIAGIARLVETEIAGEYGGGTARRWERRRIIARHVRAAVVASARAGSFASVASLYVRTLLWNLRAGRVAYVIAVPLLGAYARLTMHRR